MRDAFLAFTYSGPCADYDTMTVGETPLTHRAEDIAAYVLPQNKELKMVFQFEVVDMDSGGTEGGAEAVSPLTARKWTVLQLKKIIRKWQQYKREEGYWNSCVFHTISGSVLY